MMNRKELAPGILVYSDVLPLEMDLAADVEDSISLNSISWSAAEVLEGTVKDARDTDIIGVAYYDTYQDSFTDPRDAFNKTLSNLFLEYFKPIEMDYLGYHGVSMSTHDSYSVLRYGIGQKFINHIDDHEKIHRRVSTVYYANDNYSGGEINFPRFNISYKPKANEMIIFPSTYVYNHSVSEITEGIRYAVVSWLK